VIADPPVDEGAVQVTATEAFPAVTDEMVGAPGTFAGVTEVDAADAALLPIAAFATTLKVYAVPFVSPVTTHEVAGAVAVHVAPPGVAVTV
jgi:hypothetical protein